MDMHKRLRLARELAGFETAEEAAAALGMKYQTYVGHENSARRYSYDRAKQYAKKFKVSAEWLLEGGDEDFKSWSSKRSGDPIEIAPATPSSVRVVPEYEVHVSAGGGANIQRERIIGQWSFDQAYIDKYLGLASAELALVEVKGDSMEPTLRDGDRIMVNLSDKQLGALGIFVLYDGDGTVVKRIDKKLGDEDHVMLISDNTLYRPYEVDRESLGIVGRVVWIGRRL